MNPARGRFDRLRAAAALAAALQFAAAQADAQERIVEHAPTAFHELGQPVRLEVVIFKPPGAGPFPTVVFNHGSTGRGDDPALFGLTWTSEPLARFFNDRGWLVAFPQRRGRGNSGGLYDEGFEPDRSRYSCTPALSLAGLERALQDLDAAVAQLQDRPDVDRRKMIVGGQSRGGILAVAYAGTRPAPFRAAINFVGGWMSDRCPHPEAINTATFRRAGAARVPTLWLYGEHDAFYGIAHSRANFDAFVAAGGVGTFLAYDLGPGADGHGLIRRPDLWQAAVASFIGRLD